MSARRAGRSAKIRPANTAASGRGLPGPVEHATVLPHGS